MNDDQYTNIMNKLGEIQGEFGEHKGRTEAELENLTKRIDKSDMWENIKIVGVMPVMAVIHHIFGKNG
jgi:hypothetical protein